MKTVKILIVTAILSTSFYACKKEEMNMKAGEVNLESRSQNNLGTEGPLDATNGMIKVIFNRVGTMIIEGNPNLVNLLNMYNASSTAIASANEVFAVTQQESLTITFDKNGITIASNVPNIPVGSTIDTFINDFCHLAPPSALKLSITKNGLIRNYMEYWNAMPTGSIEIFEANVRNLQNTMPQNYTLQIEIMPGQAANVSVLDPDGNPQTTQTFDECTSSLTAGFNYVGGYLTCLSSLSWF